MSNPLADKRKHNNDVTWAPCRLISLVTRLFFQQFFRITSHKISKLHITGPLWRESTGDCHRDSPHKGPKCVHVMTSSWNYPKALIIKRTFKTAHLASHWQRVWSRSIVCWNSYRSSNEHVRSGIRIFDSLSITYMHLHFQWIFDIWIEQDV